MIEPSKWKELYDRTVLIAPLFDEGLGKGQEVWYEQAYECEVGPVSPSGQWLSRIGHDRRRDWFRPESMHLVEVL